MYNAVFHSVSHLNLLILTTRKVMTFFYYLKITIVSANIARKCGELQNKDLLQR